MAVKGFKVFLTGVSGYIGGTVFHQLMKMFPDYQYSVLVRGETSAQKIKESYPEANILRGDLDSLDLIRREAEVSDIVVNMANNDHTASIFAILGGLSVPFPEDDVLGRESFKNRYLIHTSGTSILLDKSFGTGFESAHRYSDGPEAHHELIFALPDDAWHRDVDKLVLLPDLCPRASNVHVAIICPPCVYGRGSGTGKLVSWQLPQMFKHFMKRGKGFTVNEGEAAWGNVHVQDLADIYVRLFQRAVSQNEDRSLWDITGGYYLAASGEHHWGTTMQLAADILCRDGKIDTRELDQLRPEEIRSLGAKTGPLEWGCNSLGLAVHARQALGWEPKLGSLNATAEGSEKWGANVPLGVGRHELEQEAEMVYAGLCQ